MIRRVEKAYTNKLQQSFYTKDQWKDLRLPEINHRIGRMTKDELKSKLEYLKLNPIGSKDVVTARLKSHYKRIFLIEKGGKPHAREFVTCRYFVAVDFEATCIEENGPNYPHEIIEFPAVLVDMTTGERVATFHSFVRPRINPILSEFCTRLTGITQEQVDCAPYFPVVFASFAAWLVEKGLLDRNQHDRLQIKDSTPSWTLLTDGSADICRFLSMQCKHDKIAFPYQWASKYANLKKTFQSAYRPKSKMRLEQMLEHLGMEFEGRLHSGIDDAINIARIASFLVKDGHLLYQNEEFSGKYQQSLNAPKHIYDDIEQIKALHNQMAKLAV